MLAAQGAIRTEVRRQLGPELAPRAGFPRCVKSRARCLSDVETGHTSTAVCHLGKISYKLGRKIFWDAPSETIVDQKGHPDAEANALLGREYRKGYELPKVEPA